MSNDPATLSQSTTSESSPAPQEAVAGVPASSSTDASVGNNSAQRPRPTRACSYFAQGNCRYGSECRFSHDPAVIARAINHQARNSGSGYTSNSSPKNYHHSYGSGQSQNPHQPGEERQRAQPYHQNPHYGYGPSGHSPFLHKHPSVGYFTVNIPAGQPVFSIDVECVATGVQHNSRSVAQVSLVDEWCRPLYNAYIQQDKPVVSYLTELTGITQEILESRGRPHAEVMAGLRDFLSPQAVLVGQSIHKDVQWLQLAEGIDYHSMINLSDLFRVWNAPRKAYTNFSQDHCAKVWLGMQERPHHDALTDATVSMSLFNMYRQLQIYPQQMLEMRQRTLDAPRIPGFSKKFPSIDGCCMGHHKTCICGASFE